MKLLLAIGGGVLLACIAALALTLTPAQLDVSENSPASAAAPAGPPAEPELRLSILKAGYMESQEIFSYRGGSFEPLISGMAAVLVQHPLGDVLIDTGFGADVAEHYKTIPMLMQLMAGYTPETPAAEQLRSNGYNPEDLLGIFITHAHWDHVSGIPDFPNVATRLPQAEFGFIEHGGEITALLRSFVEEGKAQLLPYRFSAEPYEIFDRSYDVHDDGSIVVVPLGGHTPGSVGIFVNLASGKRYLFAGDIVWAKEGIEIPAERPWLSRRLVDHDDARVREAIIKLHRLQALYPDLVIVPAHDRRIHEQLAQYPETAR